MIEVPITEDSLEAAKSRIQDFIAVQNRNPDKGEALTVLRESLGITDEMLHDYEEWSETILGDYAAQVPMLLGLMVGLIAADYAAQS